MFRLLALTVLCGMCISVFADDDLKDCVFDFQSFEADSDSEDTILDHSGLAISKLVEDSYTTAYLTGEFRIRSKVDSSIQAIYRITKIGSNTNPMWGRLNACKYSASFYPQYLKPIAGMRGDVPPDTTLCDMDPGTIVHLSPANSLKDLTAGSKLGRGNYMYEVEFRKNGTPVGGFTAKFNVYLV